MNKDNAHLYLPLVQALADGKEIETQFAGKWSGITELSFNSNITKYRIKQEPVFVEVALFKNKTPTRINSYLGQDQTFSFTKGYAAAKDSNFIQVSDWVKIEVKEKCSC